MLYCSTISYLEIQFYKHSPDSHTIEYIKDCLGEINTIGDLSAIKINVTVRHSVKNIVKVIDNLHFLAASSIPYNVWAQLKLSTI